MNINDLMKTGDFTNRAANEAGGFENILENPFIISLMARTGAGLDPQGLGGTLGTATQETINQAQMAKAAREQKDFFARLLEAVSGKNALKSALISPTGEIKLEAFEGLEEPSEKITTETPSAMTKEIKKPAEETSILSKYF